MNDEEYTSYWVGYGENEDVFDKLIDYTITENGLGDFEPSPFCKALGIDNYEPDYFGGRFYRQSRRLSLLLHKDPNIEQIKEKWATIPESNCFLVLGEYKYENQVKEIEIEGFSFTFLGSYKNGKS